MLAGWLAGGLEPRAVSVIDPAPSDWLLSTGTVINGVLPEAPAALIVAVKPQIMDEALPQAQTLGGGGTVVVSIAAGTGLGDLRPALAPARRSCGQGICAMNSDGKVLAWACRSILKTTWWVSLTMCSLDINRSRTIRKPLLQSAFTVFPARVSPTWRTTKLSISIPLTHPEGDRCLGDLPQPPGALVGTIVGRALDEAGEPVANTRLQENYTEARVIVTESVQRALRQVWSPPAVNDSSCPLRLLGRLCRAPIWECST